MKRSKYSNIPMTVVDTRFQELAKSADPPHRISGKKLPDMDLKTLVILLAEHLWVQWRKPLIALKYHAVQRLKRFPQVKKLPWLKIGFLILVAFVLFKKEMSVDFALKAPLPIFDEDQGDNKPSVAQSVALTSAMVNPYAPAEPLSLRDRQVRDFVKSYGPLAVKEMHQSGVPASIKIGQALIESHCGQSKLATKNNNFFGIKCFSKKCAKGHCTNATDDHHKDFFRKYKTANDSFRHHSQLLTGGRYKHLKKYGKNYVKWAKGLKKAGYATDKSYDKKLIRIIEKYKLYNLDKR